MNVKTDKEIINGILEDDDKTLRFIYKKYYPKIKIMVMTFRNVNIIADDIFQEGLTRAIMNIKAGKFEGRSSFLTYFSGICKNVCLKELSNNKYASPVIDDIAKADDEQQNFELIKFVIRLKDSMDAKCIEIINCRFGLDENQNTIVEHKKTGNVRFEKIAKKLGIKTDNARQRFKRCLKKLQQNISNHPEFSKHLS